MIEKLPVNGFKWVKKISKFNERFIKSYNLKKLVCGIKKKEKYVIHIRALKQALNHGLIL